MRDALRAAERVPGFLDALLGSSGRDERADAREAAGLLPAPLTPPHGGGRPPAVAWHRRCARGAGWRGHRHRQRVPRCAADPAARVRRGGWRERVVELDAAGALRFAIGDKAARCSSDASIAGRRHPRAAGRRGRGARRAGRAHRALRRALHRLRPGRARLWRYAAGRAPATPTSIRSPTPGAADLTAHVQFAALADKARAAGLAADGPITQAEFLGALGIAERTARLMAANPERAGEIETAVQRLDFAHRHGLAVQGAGGALARIFRRRRRSARTLPMPKPVTADRLAAVGTPAGIRHGFFTRQGGVSRGVYASLNCGLGSRDDPAAVRENRARVARFLDARQPSSPRTRCTAPPPSSSTGPGAGEERPRADAIVTATPGIALGVLTADCAPVLFADPQARVVAAAHAGWRGAIGGVLEATLAAMEGLGARRDRHRGRRRPLHRPGRLRGGPGVRGRSSSPATRAARHSSSRRRRSAGAAAFRSAGLCRCIA